MAATPTIVRRSHQGTVRVNYVDVLLDNSYPTGGYALTPAQLGFTKVPLVVDAEPNTGRSFWYDRVNQKLKSFNSGGTETTAATDLSAVTVRLSVEGTV
jgi:hypothetical protein